MRKHHRSGTAWQRTIRDGWWYVLLIHWGYPYLVPWLGKRHRIRLPLPIRLIGYVVAITGGILTTWAIRTLVRDGQGTPAPHDPPQHFVCSGPYCHCRNPMELGNALTMIGWTVAHGCPRRAVAALLFAASIHAWIVLIEEPYLMRHFDLGYRLYRSHVPRWGWRRAGWRM